MPHGPLAFARFRVPASESELTSLEREQLDVIDDRVDYGLGEPDRLAPGAPFASAFELWDVVDTESGEVVATAFGTGMDFYVFAADSAELLGHAFQHCYDGHDRDLTAALASATRPGEAGFVLPTIRFPVCSTASRPLPAGRLDVDWSTLTCPDPTAPKRGPRGGGSWPEISARGLPSRVRALAYGSDDESSDAEWALRWILAQPPQRVTAPAVDLLLSTVADGAAHEASALSLVAHLLEHATQDALPAVQDAVRAWRPELEAWVAGPGPEAASAVLEKLGSS